MKRFLIASHGQLATGFSSALEVITGKHDNVHIFNCYVDDFNIQEEATRFLDKYKTENIIVITDLIGGSVNQVFLKLMENYKFHLISGANLSLILELIVNPMATDSESSIKIVIEQAKNQIVYLNDIEKEINDIES